MVPRTREPCLAGADTATELPSRCAFALGPTAASLTAPAPSTTLRAQPQSDATRLTGHFAGRAGPRQFRVCELGPGRRQASRQPQHAPQAAAACGGRRVVGLERHQPRRPTRPRLPVRSGDAALCRHRPQRPPLATNSLNSKHKSSSLAGTAQTAASGQQRPRSLEPGVWLHPVQSSHPRRRSRRRSACARDPPAHALTAGAGN
jgi:hypothetical protein